jgi:hypothetical protein
VVLTCTLLAGCSSNFELEKFAAIEDGMTLGEVEGVLGPGSEVSWTKVESILESFPQVGITEASCDQWIMWGSSRSFGLVGFQNGKVTQRISR